MKQCVCLLFQLAEQGAPTGRSVIAVTHPSKAFSLTRAVSGFLSFFLIPCFFLIISAASAPIAASMSSGSTSSNQRSSLKKHKMKNDTKGEG